MHTHEDVPDLSLSPRNDLPPHTTLDETHVWAENLCDFFWSFDSAFRVTRVDSRVSAVMLRRPEDRRAVRDRVPDGRRTVRQSRPLSAAEADGRGPEDAPNVRFRVARLDAENQVYSKPPFVLLSSSNYSTDIHAAFVQGANDYPIKPSGASELIQRLQALLSACEACNFTAEGWLSFAGNQPLGSAGRDAIPLLIKGPFPGALNITARFPEN